MQDLLMALEQLSIQSPFNELMEGLYSADLAMVITTLQSLSDLMDPTKQAQPQDTRDELVKFYEQAMNHKHKLYIDPNNSVYLERFACKEPVRVFQMIFFEQMTHLTCNYKAFRCGAMQPILRDALLLNHSDYPQRVEHRQLAIAAAYFILWFTFKSVEQGEVKSIPYEVVNVIMNCSQDSSGYYPHQLGETISFLVQSVRSSQ